MKDTIHDIRDSFSEHDDGCYAKDRGGINHGLRRKTADTKVLEIMDNDDLENTMGSFKSFHESREGKVGSLGNVGNDIQIQEDKAIRVESIDEIFASRSKDDGNNLNNSTSNRNRNHIENGEQVGDKEE